MTYTPTPIEPPVIYCAGYLDTSLSPGNNRILKIYCWVHGSNIKEVRLYYNKIYTGVNLIKETENELDSFYSLNIPVDIGESYVGNYLIGIKAINEFGDESKMWPRLEVFLTKP